MSMPSYPTAIVDAAVKAGWTGRMLRDAADHVDQIREEDRILAEMDKRDGEEPA